jgi:hypothetical protein
MILLRIFKLVFIPTVLLSSCPPFSCISAQLLIAEAFLFYCLDTHLYIVLISPFIVLMTTF